MRDIVQDGGGDDGAGLDEVWAVASLDPDADPGDGSVARVGDRERGALGRRAAQLGIELLADIEQFAGIAPGRYYVLHHFA